MTDAVPAPASRTSPGVSLGIAAVPNLRDLGGYQARDGGVVRGGLVYRSSQLTAVGAEDLQRIAALGLRYDFDLRTPDEADRGPDELPPGVERVFLNVFADALPVVPGALDKLLENPAEANRALAGRIDVAVERVYRALVSLPSARQCYARLFAALADPGSLPALFHCTAGKDRTGWAAAALLTLLDVPEETVMQDYLRSNDIMLAHYQPLIDQFVAGGGEPEIAYGIFGVKAEYLRAAFDEVERQYGTIDGYVSDGLGLAAATTAALRSALLHD
jgi:protein-tyrosine phosphatase